MKNVVICHRYKVPWMRNKISSMRWGGSEGGENGVLYSKLIVIPTDPLKKVMLNNIKE